MAQSFLDLTLNGAKVGAQGVISGTWQPPPTVPESDGMCQKRGVTDDGVFTTAKIKAALAAATTAYNTYQAYKIAKKQRDLATRYLEIAEEHRQYFNNLYKPLEISAIYEAKDMPKFVRDKDRTYRGQILISMRAGYAGTINDQTACTGRYCTGQRAALVSDAVLEQATAEMQAGQMAHRYADKEEELMENRRWERRNQVLRQGRDMNNDAVAYADLALGVFGNLGRQFSSAAQSGAAFLGFNSARGRPVYPERRAPTTIPSYTFRDEGEVSRPTRPELINLEVGGQ